MRSLTFVLLVSSQPKSLDRLQAVYAGHAYVWTNGLMLVNIFFLALVVTKIVSFAFHNLILALGIMLDHFIIGKDLFATKISIGALKLHIFHLLLDIFLY